MDYFRTGPNIPYMGTKHWLGENVRTAAGKLGEGPMLDIFAGMSAVGKAVSPERQVWTNDVQRFPTIVAQLVFGADRYPHLPDELEPIVSKAYERNQRRLSKWFDSELRAEKRYLETESLECALSSNQITPFIGTDPILERARCRLARKPNTFPYRLFTITYSGTYLGLLQCIEVDSLRYALDDAVARSVMNDEQRNWCLVALGEAVSRVNNSTGHFAQFLRPSAGNLDRVIRQRKRSVVHEFYRALAGLKPLRSRQWRRENKAYCLEALELISALKSSKSRPDVIYADPPYSDAQYSRYYHLLETLVLYNYPPVSGVGRYPPGRFQTPFSQLSTVEEAMECLVRGAAELGSSLLLSYPKNGLYLQVGKNLKHLVGQYYGQVRVSNLRGRLHSTLGGGNAPPKVTVDEQLFVASAPRH